MPKKTKSKPAKKQASALNKLLDKALTNRDRQLTEKWRLLRKLGVYTSTETPAMKRLTNYRRKEITRRFNEIQTMRSYDYKGRVVRPITEKVVETKRGKNIRYELTNRFAFVKTKNKTNVIEGVRKTNTGYILEKPPNVEKVGINKRGEIVETRGEFTRARNRMRGRELLKFLNELESGKKKLKPRQYISMHRWGARADAIEFDAKQFVGYMTGLEQEMREEIYGEFVDTTYIELIQYAD